MSDGLSPPPERKNMAEDRKLLDKKSILEIKDIETEEVYVPEWSGKVIVRALSGREMDAFEVNLSIHDGKKISLDLIQNARAKLVARSLVDENGHPLFSERDVQALGEKSGRALDRIYEVASRLSGLGNREMESLLKNSPPGQSDGSG